MNAELDNMQVVSDQVNKTVSSTALSLEGWALLRRRSRIPRRFISVEGGIRYVTARRLLPTGIRLPLVIWLGAGSQGASAAVLIRSSGSDATVNITLFK